MTASRMLRHSRRRAGMTQRELARATGIAQPMIARIERGASVPTFDTLERLLGGTGNALEVSTRLGDGVDRSLVKAALAMNLEERIIAAGRAASNLSSLISEVHSARRRG